VYNALIPRITDISVYRTSTGLEKFFSIYVSTINPFEKFYVKNPQFIILGNTLWSLIIILFLFIFMIIMIKKCVMRSPLEFEECLVLSILISGTLMALIYSELGIFETGFIIFAGILSIGMVYKNQTKIFQKKVIISLILILIIIGMLPATQIEIEKSISALKESNPYFYMDSSFSWFSTYVVPEYAIQNSYIDRAKEMSLTSDVFTGGRYYSMLVNQGNTRFYPKYFTTVDLNLILLDKKGNTKTDNIIYIINNKLESFNGQNWAKLSSLKKYKYEINLNNYIDTIYDNFDIQINKPSISY
jgi:hypothetical protein